MTQQPHYWAYTQRNHNSKCHMKPSVHCSTIYSSQATEATQMCINRCMDEEGVVHIHNGMLFSHKKNEFGSVVVRWMNLEPVIQSEVDQNVENKYHILIHIRGI